MADERRALMGVVAINAAFCPLKAVIVLPITTKRKNIPTHVPVPKGEAGLTEDSYIMCEDIRAVSKDRLQSYRGNLKYPYIELVQLLVRVLSGL